MWSKRHLLIVFGVIVIVVSASIGFFELGLSRGETEGYNAGYFAGLNAILIQSGTQVQLQPNQTLTIVTLPFSASNTDVYYSFVISGPYSLNATVEMNLSSPGHTLVGTGYIHSMNSVSSLSLSTTNVNVLTIMFRANQNNNGPTVLEFNSPLRMSFS